MPQLPIGDIGPCEVTWDYGGANPIVITPHLGMVTLRMSDAVTDVHKEPQGAAPVEAFFEGATVELEVPMARSTLSQLKNTIGYDGMGLLVGNVLTLYNIAGIEMYAQAKQIVIKPMLNVGGCAVEPDPNPNHWVILYKCHPYRDFELGYDRARQRVHMVKFKVFANQDSGYEGEYFQEGLVGWRGEFEDDFCDSPLGAEWTTHGLDENKTITLDATSPCWVTISILNNVQSLWWCSNAAWNLCPKMYMPLNIIGPCRITTKLRTYTVNDDTMAGIFIGTQPETPGVIGTNYAYVFGRYRDGSAGLTYRLRVQTNCSSFKTDEPAAPPYEPIWLRIDVDAAQDIRFYFSQDGIAWELYELQGEGGPGTPLVINGYDIPNCYVGLFAKNISTVAPTNIAAPFEFFTIESYA